jgi:hypothetical protein
LAAKPVSSSASVSGLSTEANAHTIRVAHIARTPPNPISVPGEPTVHVTVSGGSAASSRRPTRPT